MSSSIMMRVGARGLGQSQVEIKKKEWNDVILTGTVAEMKSGHAQWSCSMPRTASVTRDYFVS